MSGQGTFRATEAGAIMRPVIIDFHTHIFPPDVRDSRDGYAGRDATFAEMYTNPKAKIATAEDLRRSMDEAGVDVSVALGFAWREHELCVRHNDYLLESAAKSGGRIVPFCTINMAVAPATVTKEVARCARAGARGLGELRPESQGWELNGEAGERVAALAQRHNLILLFHVTEPVGRQYPGKEGCSLGSFCEFAREHPEIAIIGAHLGGGLPFYGAMSEVGDALSHVYVDTAALPLLYGREVYRLADGGHLLLGSDFPLVGQARQIEEMRGGLEDEAARRLVLGENARRLLGLEHGG